MDITEKMTVNMFARRLYFLTAIVFLFTAVIGVAQTSTESFGTLTIGDAVELTLQPGETVRYDLAIAGGESFEFNTSHPRDAGWMWSYISSEGWTREINMVPVSTRLIGRDDRQYQLEIINTTDSDTDVQFELTEVPMRTLALGERVILTEDDPLNIEFTFSLTEPQAVTLYSTGQAYGSYVENGFNYALERIEGGVSVSQLVPFGEMSDSTFGFMLEPGDYRLVIMNLLVWMRESVEDAETRDTDELQFVELRPVTTLRETISVGETLTMTADMQPIEITVALESGNLYQAAIESEGAQVLITDANGNRIDDFGHGAIAHALAFPRFVVPEDGIYTMHFSYPGRGVLMDGELTIASGYIDFPWLDSFVVGSPLDIATGEQHHYCQSVREDVAYRVQLRTVDGDPIDGTIEVDVIQIRNDDRMPEETVLQAEMRDTATADFVFTATANRFAVMRLSGLDGVDTSVDVDFGYAEEDSPPVSVRC